jgi:hypothetical protein
MSEQAWQGLQSATRREKSRRVVRYVGPNYPSQAQVNLLAGMIGTQVLSDLEAFVRFANGYDPSPILTKIHYIHAIDLAMNGSCLYGTAEELVRMSSDPDFIPDTDPGEFQRRMIARRKGKAKGTKRKAKTNADLFAPTMADLKADKAQRTLDLVKRLEAEKAARFTPKR